jgi:hypothetical protein
MWIQLLPSVSSGQVNLEIAARHPHGAAGFASGFFSVPSGMVTAIA